MVEMLNVVDAQDRIIEALASDLPIPLVEQAIPDAQTVRKVDGKIEPYAAIQFGDPRDMSQGRSFAGVRYNDYEIPIYLQVVAANPTVARKLSSGVVLSTLLGFSQPWTGEVRKRPGGGMWPVVNSNGATEAYLFPSSWAVTVQFHEA